MMKRYSPASFEGNPAQTVMRNGWEVVLAYQEEGAGPLMVDLSHISKWDIQAADLSQIQLQGANIPEVPGACVLRNRMLISRMNQTQASVWHLSHKDLQIPDESAYTDITEGLSLLGFLGQEIFSIMEKITALDLQSPQKQPPFLLQGPVLNIPCQVVVLGKDALVIGFSRGYAQSAVEAIFEAGQQWGIQPAGELAFSGYIQDIEKTLLYWSH
jgi:hypothetical protein